jgi:thiamine biosynthesis lipoprotein
MTMSDLAYFKYEFFALGSDCVFQLFATCEAMAHAASAQATREVFRIEGRYSRYRDDSELSRINKVAAQGGTIEVDAETAALLDYAYACYRLSGGLFDITSGVLRKVWNFSSGRVPSKSDVTAILPRVGLDKIRWDSPRLTFDTPGMELDFGGIGKEYAVDRAAQICRAMGVEHGLIDLGGDISLIGPRADGSAWRIGIRDPTGPTQPLTTVGLASGALATSGDYERRIELNGQRYGHILNPRTGWPARGIISVSVISDECLIAGTLATIAMLKGRNGAAWLRSRGVRHIVVDQNGRVGGTEISEVLGRRVDERPRSRVARK